MSAHRLTAATIVAAVLLSGCAAGPDPLEAEPVATTDVAVRDNVFAPLAIAVDVGDTVTWTWEGELRHNVIGAGAGVELATELMTDGTYTSTFEEAGTIAYRCTIHSGMRGAVIVGGGR